MCRADGPLVRYVLFGCSLPTVTTVGMSISGVQAATEDASRWSKAGQLLASETRRFGRDPDEAFSPSMRSSSDRVYVESKRVGA